MGYRPKGNKDFLFVDIPERSADFAKVYFCALICAAREILCRQWPVRSLSPRQRGKDDDDDSVKFDDCATNSMETSEEGIKYINWRVLLSC